MSTDRKTYIGGSDVARIVGVSAYGGPVALWRQKTGRDHNESSPLLRAGLHMEAFILREYEASGAVLRAGHETADGRHIWAQQTARHPRLTWAGATVDTFANRDGARIVVDAKCSRKAIDANDAESVPWDWTLQLHHYGWICGIDRAELALCRVGADWSVVAVPVALDLDWYEAAIVPRLAAFWACVVEDREPAPVAPVERDPPPQLGDEAQAACDRYLAAGIREGLANADKAEAREDLRRILESAGLPRLAIAGKHRVSSWSIAGRESIDAKALRVEMPDVAERFTRRGEPSIGLRVTTPGERP